MRYVAALLALGFGSYCAYKIIDGLRTGEMQLIVRGDGPYLLRKEEPILFWSAAAFNSFLAICMFAGVAIALFKPAVTK